MAVNPKRRWIKHVIRNHEPMYEEYPETGRACVWFDGLVEIGTARTFALTPDEAPRPLRGTETYSGLNPPTGNTEPVGSRYGVQPVVGPGAAYAQEINP
jgi:hypothetical protein